MIDSKRRKQNLKKLVLHREYSEIERFDSKFGFSSLKTPQKPNLKIVKSFQNLRSGYFCYYYYYST